MMMKTKIEEKDSRIKGIEDDYKKKIQIRDKKVNDLESKANEHEK